MNYFDYENLDIYKTTIELIVAIDSIVKNLPRGKAYLADQLQRAGSSVLLNIAEGAGEFATNEKNRFYRMSRRSATECAGILDILLWLKIIEKNKYSNCRELLIRIVSMLTKMVKNA